jgi:hypothetical protein
MQHFCSFKDALLAFGLPVADLATDGTRYFAFGHRKGEPVAFVGFGCFDAEDLLQSLMEPALLRGQNHGSWAIDIMTQHARQPCIWRSPMSNAASFVRVSGMSNVWMFPPPSPPRGNSWPPIQTQRCRCASR